MKHLYPVFPGAIADPVLEVKARSWGPQQRRTLGKTLEAWGQMLQLSADEMDKADCWQAIKNSKSVNWE